VRETAGSPACAARSVLASVHDVLGAIRPAEDDDLRLRRRLGDPADCVQAVLGELELDEAEVRLQTGGGRERGLRVADLGDDGETALLEGLADSAPVWQLVIGDENRQWLEG
jgi:hypothetical protein